MQGGGRLFNVTRPGRLCFQFFLGRCFSGLIEGYAWVRFLEALRKRRHQLSWRACQARRCSLFFHQPLLHFLDWLRKCFCSKKKKYTTTLLNNTHNNYMNDDYDDDSLLSRMWVWWELAAVPRSNILLFVPDQANSLIITSIATLTFMHFSFITLALTDSWEK